MHPHTQSIPLGAEMVITTYDAYYTTDTNVRDYSYIEIILLDCLFPVRFISIFRPPPPPTCNLNNHIKYFHLKAISIHHKAAYLIHVSLFLPVFFSKRPHATALLFLSIPGCRCVTKTSWHIMSSSGSRGWPCAAWSLTRPNTSTSVWSIRPL